VDAVALAAVAEAIRSVDTKSGSAEFAGSADLVAEM
jgi:hypothetical protein